MHLPAGTVMPPPLAQISNFQSQGLQSTMLWTHPCSCTKLSVHSTLKSSCRVGITLRGGDGGCSKIWELSGGWCYWAGEQLPPDLLPPSSWRWGITTHCSMRMGKRTETKAHEQWRLLYVWHDEQGKLACPPEFVSAIPCRDIGLMGSFLPKAPLPRESPAAIYLTTFLLCTLSPLAAGNLPSGTGMRFAPTCSQTSHFKPFFLPQSN